jgi:hypothetical protein
MHSSISFLSILLAVVNVSGTRHNHKHASNTPDEPEIVNSFKWQRPFPSDDGISMGMEVKCESIATFKASQFKLRDIQHPSPWGGPVETFLGWHPYPGSWEGLDHGGAEREYLMVEYKDVPDPVREWISAQHENKQDDKSRWWMYAVMEKPNHDKKAAMANTDRGVADEDKVLFFPPASLYDILPLWVAKGAECACEYTCTIEKRSREPC